MSSKAREALDKIGNISAYVAEASGNADTAKYMNDIISIVQAALAEPVRNCDMGTAEEQAERFFVLCNSYKCTSCPFRFTKKTDCALIWSQMPYESEVSDAEK